MGLKKGEKIERICQIRIVSTVREELGQISQADVVREGFPDWNPEQFVAMFTEHNRCLPTVIVNRIEFEYLDSNRESIMASNDQGLERHEWVKET